MHRSTLASRLFPLLSLILLLAACTLPVGNSGNASRSSTPTTAPTHGGASTTPTAAQVTCPAPLNDTQNCYTPYGLRVAYDVESLTERGYTGKGQTIIDIVSYGSPTLQQDMDVFDQQFGLPPIKIQVVAPLGTVPFDPHNKDMVGWAGETELDVQIMHAIAPDANIVVMTSPVDETEGTIGLPQFMKLEQYAVAHHLGQIFSQSYVASEATLTDSVSQQFIKSYANFYQQITTRQGITIVNGSGDNGATDWKNLAATKLAPTRTVNFPADVPWVTAVGGTALLHTTSGYNETAWSGSGGGTSKFFSEPDFQRSMSSSVQSLLAGQRGIPDIAADADPNTGMAFYIGGQWDQTGGTSASTPFWAAIVAIANQMAGHPLGFINPGIYKLAASPQAQQDFRDVTTGNNSVNGAVQVQGFQAVPGWDAVTGWGSPRASKFIPDLIATLK
jgi:subtilase family serine protease